ncbi:Ttn [Symbiodinium sp. CCMP2592]|nr:Ttn [Symbiodinium sp. CCMP2592]
MGACRGHFWILISALSGLAGADEFSETCQSPAECSSEGQPHFQPQFCARPRPIYRSEFSQELNLTLQHCADICRHTIGCVYFGLGDHSCDTFSSCNSEWSEAAHLAANLYQIPEDPARCDWTSRHLRGQASRAVRAAMTRGGELQQHLVEAALHHVNSPAFAACPVAGAAIRILHVWAAASYHHGWRPRLAFATEAQELPFSAELALILDTPWAHLLRSQWAKALFLGLSQLAEGLCQRLEKSASETACSASSASANCNLKQAALLLETTKGSASPKALQKAQALASGCASDGRLSSMLRIKDASRLFTAIAKLAPSSHADGEEDLDLESFCTGTVAHAELDGMATRMTIRDEHLAAIGLAASTRRCANIMGSGKMRLLDVLVFIEQLQSTGHVSGFFNVVTENRCEMDFFSHFHNVFCLLPGGSDQNEAKISPAFMTSGLLVHPPYGPAAWSCILPSKQKKLEVRLLDPVRWQRPLRMNLDLKPVSKKYNFAVCPQPLYRLEAHRDLLEDWLEYHRKMGVEHWTIYDLDGSGAAALSRREDVDFHPNLPSMLNSPRLAEGNWWNPICLEAIALTQCFWRYRGRAAMVFSLHSFDEFLVSARHRHGGFRRWMSAAGPDNLTTVVRLPAVNYGGAGLSGDSPLIQQFRRHTGRLYWHIVGANPDHVLSVNTTNAWPEPPRKQMSFFQPDVLRVNHYVDALGARDRREDVFVHEDPEKVLGWAAEELRVARDRRASLRDRRLFSVAGPLLAALRRVGEMETPEEAPNISALLDASSESLSPALRVAFRLAGTAEDGHVRKVLRDGFVSCDLDQDRVLSSAEFIGCSEPSGWDAHLQRRDFHYIGLFLHSWASKATAKALFDGMDVAPSDGGLSSQEWEEGCLRLCAHQEISDGLKLLNDWSQRDQKSKKACLHHSIPISRSEAEAIFARLGRSTPGGMRITFQDLEYELQKGHENIEEVCRAREMIVAMNHVLVEKHGSSLEANFEQFGQEGLPPEDIHKVFSAARPLSVAQWQALLPFLDKRPDGSILWRSVLAWAGITASRPKPAAPASSPAVPAAALPAEAVALPKPAASVPAMQPHHCPAAPLSAPSSCVAPAPAPAVTPCISKPSAPLGPSVPPPGPAKAPLALPSSSPGPSPPPPTPATPDTPATATPAAPAVPARPKSATSPAQAAAALLGPPPPRTNTPAAVPSLLGRPASTPCVPQAATLSSSPAVPKIGPGAATPPAPAGPCGPPPGPTGPAVPKIGPGAATPPAPTGPCGPPPGPTGPAVPKIGPGAATFAAPTGPCGPPPGPTGPAVPRIGAATPPAPTGPCGPPPGPTGPAVPKIGPGAATPPAPAGPCGPPPGPTGPTPNALAAAALLKPGVQTPPTPAGPTGPPPGPTGPPPGPAGPPPGPAGPPPGATACPPTSCKPSGPGGPPPGPAGPPPGPSGPPPGPAAPKLAGPASPPPGPAGPPPGPTGPPPGPTGPPPGPNRPPGPTGPPPSKPSALPTTPSALPTTPSALPTRPSALPTSTPSALPTRPSALPTSAPAACPTTPAALPSSACAPRGPAGPPPGPGGSPSHVSASAPPPGPAGPPPAACPTATHFSSSAAPTHASCCSAPPPGPAGPPPGPCGPPPGPTGPPPGPGMVDPPLEDGGGSKLDGKMDAATRRKAELDAKMASRQREAEERRAKAKARAAALKAVNEGEG